MKYQTDVLVIGGGPAGLMAAIFTAKNGREVTILEKMDRPARKLLITGKGRCNVTNNVTNEEFLKNICHNPKFLFSAINTFSTRETMCFFEENGVALKTERGKRVFPVSDKAVDIVDAMVNCAKKNKVKFLKGRAIKIVYSNKVEGILTDNNEQILCNKLIIATGGMSYPKTGSTGDGYSLVKEVGHTLIEPKPSLVPLESKDSYCKILQGLSLKNVSLSLIKGDKVVYKEQGEMLFTHFGVSGPLVLSASAFIEGNIKEYRLLIDLKPALDEKTLDNRVLRDFDEFKNKDISNALDKLLPKKLIPVVLDLASINPYKKVNEITKNERQALISKIKGLEVNINSTRPIDEAIITRGGISTKEINPKTMESKILPGLYFAGEIIDVDGFTGGFNLQIAFSTGAVCGGV